MQLDILYLGKRCGKLPLLANLPHLRTLLLLDQQVDVVYVPVARLQRPGQLSQAC